jgi:hypothetical protein
MVSSILWYQSARRAAFTVAFPSMLGQRVNLLAWHIAILPFEKLVLRAPATLAFGFGHFPFMGGQRTRESRERDERRATGERPGR